MNEGIMQTDVQQIQGSDVGEAVEPRNRAYATQRVYSQVEKPTGLGGEGGRVVHGTPDVRPRTK